MKKEFHWTVRVIIEKEGNLYIAHCLEFDLVTQAKTLKGAKEMIIDAIYEYLSYAVKNNLQEQVFRPAPSEYWAKIPRASKEETISPRSKPIESPRIKIFPKVTFDNIPSYATVS